jgi:branched-chain amino acid transport system permease protein
LNDPKYQLLFLVVVLAVALFAAWRMKESRFGMALAAIAGSEDAARALGINVSHYKLAAFVIAAVYAAIAGSLMAHFVGFISPEVFGLHMVIAGFMMLYVGGIGSIAGPVFGALIVSLLPETFRAFKEYQDLAYGAALILILIFAPKGAASLSRLLPKARK